MEALALYVAVVWKVTPISLCPMIPPIVHEISQAKALRDFFRGVKDIGNIGLNMFLNGGLDGDHMGFEGEVHEPFYLDVRLQLGTVHGVIDKCASFS